MNVACKVYTFTGLTPYCSMKNGKEKKKVSNSVLTCFSRLHVADEQFRQLRVYNIYLFISTQVLKLIFFILLIREAAHSGLQGVISFKLKDLSQLIWKM